MIPSVGSQVENHQHLGPRKLHLESDLRGRPSHLLNFKTNTHFVGNHSIVEALVPAMESGRSAISCPLSQTKRECGENVTWNPLRKNPHWEIRRGALVECSSSMGVNKGLQV
jgi:hypothetical protein